jgi:hypothetical protein
MNQTSGPAPWTEEDGAPGLTSRREGPGWLSEERSDEGDIGKESRASVGQGGGIPGAANLAWAFGSCCSSGSTSRQYQTALVSIDQRTSASCDRKLVACTKLLLERRNKQRGSARKDPLQ